MSFIDDLGSALKSIGDSISKALSNSEMIKALLPVLGLVLPPPLDVVAVVGLMAISAALGQPEDPEKLGYQMNKAGKEGISPDDFDSFKEYKEHLDKNFPFDQKEFDKLSDAQKSACRYVGMAGTMQELKEEKGFDISAEALKMFAGSDGKPLGNTGLTTKEEKGNFVANVTTEMQAQGFHSLQPVVDYAKGELEHVSDGPKVEAAVQKVLDSTPGLEDKDTFEVICSLADKE